MKSEYLLDIGIWVDTLGLVKYVPRNREGIRIASQSLYSRISYWGWKDPRVMDPLKHVNAPYAEGKAVAKRKEPVLTARDRRAKRTMSLKLGSIEKLWET
jgi:hypothetical protein